MKEAEARVGPKVVGGFSSGKNGRIFLRPRRCHPRLTPGSGMKNALPIRFRLAALWILAAVPILTGVVPVLDVWADDTRVGIEDHHHPGTHGIPHNHLICIQQQASHWAPSADLPGVPAVRLLTTGDPPCPVRTLLPGRDLLSPRPRSPPIA